MTREISKILVTIIKQWLGGNEYPVLNTVQRAACFERRADDIFNNIKTFCAVCGFETGEVVDLLVERQIARERAIENARREQKEVVPPRSMMANNFNANCAKAP